MKTIGMITAVSWRVLLGVPLKLLCGEKLRHNMQMDY